MPDRHPGPRSLQIGRLLVLSILVFGVLLSCAEQNQRQTELDSWAAGIALPAGVELQSRAAAAFREPAQDSAYAGTLRVAYSQAPQTYNTLFASGPSALRLFGLLQAPLARRNPFSFEYEPVLAESWTVSRDQTSIRVRLRDEMFWSDGTPISAADWVEAYTDFVYDEDLGASAAEAYLVEGRYLAWELINDKEFSFSLPFVHPALVSDFLESPPYPVHMLKAAMQSGGHEAVRELWKSGSDLSTLPSTGPWVIVSEEPGESLELGRNAMYLHWDSKARALPYLDSIEIAFIPEFQDRLAAFTKGQLDYLDLNATELGGFQSSLSALDAEESAGQAIALRVLGPELGVDLLAFNADPKESEDDLGIEGPELELLSNSEFRAAFVAYVRTLDLIQYLPAGLGIPADSPVYRLSPYWTDSDTSAAGTAKPTATAATNAEAAAAPSPESELEPEPEELTPAQRLAAALDQLDVVDSDGNGMREFADGRPAELRLLTNSDSSARVAIAVAIAEALLDQGIRLVVDTPNFNGLVEALTRGGDWHLAFLGITLGADPSSAANWLPSSGALHLIEPGQREARRPWEAELDLAWELGNNTLQAADRADAFAQIQALLRREAPWGILYAQPALAGFSTRFENLFALPVPGYGWEAFSDKIFVKDDSSANP